MIGVDGKAALRRVGVRCILGLIALLVAAACREAAAPVEESSQLLTGPRPALATGGAAGSPDSTPGQMSVAHVVPGFGGYFLDADGVPAVYLTDGLQRPLAEIALTAFLANRGFAASDLRVLPGRFRYSQLDTWYRLAQPSVFAIDGIVLGNVDEGLNRLRFGVTSATAAAAVLGALTALDIPPNAVVIEQVF